MTEQWVTVARVIKPHGLKGELKLCVMSDEPSRFNPGACLWVKGEKKEILSRKELNNGIIIGVAGITNMEQAETLRGEDLCIPIEELPELSGNEYYAHELFGMEVRSPDGTPWGTVIATFNGPTVDMVEVKTPDGKQVMVPLREDVLGAIDKNEKTIIISRDLFSELLE